MKLLVDIGNTRLKWLALQDQYVVNRGHLLHLGIAPETWGGRLWQNLKRPEQVLIANVTGSETASALTAWIAENWSLEAVFVLTEKRRFGVNNGYQEAEKLGVDRWVAMVGARCVSKSHNTIIDCGTAITIDALDANGQHQGGVIIPGIRLMHESLFRKTSQIPEQEMGDIVYLGRNTQDCVWGGIVHTLAAAIDRISNAMADSMQKQSPGEVCHLLTGGNAEALLPYLENSYRLEPDLIFRGLRVIAGP